MKRLGKYILAATLTAVCGNMMAQGLNSGYFTEDYKFRHNLNPAFDNQQNYVSLPALGNLNVRAQATSDWATCSSTTQNTVSTATTTRLPL